MRIKRVGNALLNGLIVTILLGAGVVLGNKLGEMRAEHEMKRLMHRYSSQLLDLGKRVVASAEKTLAEANSSPFEPCSYEDQIYLRKLIFAGYQIKDIGRVEGDTLRCSVLLHDLKSRAITSLPDAVTKAGSLVFADRALITPGSHGPIMINGQANIVIGSSAFDPLRSDNYAFAVFLANPTSTRTALLFSYPEGATPRTPVGSDGDTFQFENGAVSEHRCDFERTICVTLTRDYGGYSGTISWEKYLWRGLGLMFGALLCLGRAVLTRRDRSLNYRLLRAINERKLDVFYQPIIDLSDGSPIGFEALLRWEIRPSEFVPPDVFIAIAEKQGYSDRLTCYVCDMVAREMGHLLRTHPTSYVTINVTGNDIEKPAFVERFERHLAEAQISPKQIGIELTERTAVELCKAKNTIARLRQSGHRIYIDDFGTGYSSLGYLGELEVDAIKIDKVFTRGVGKNASAISIVPQIIAMARIHNLDVIVEGIETSDQANYFRRLRPSVLGQGWYYSAALPAREAIAFFNNRETVPIRKTDDANKVRRRVYRQARASVARQSS